MDSFARISDARSDGWIVPPSKVLLSRIATSWDRLWGLPTNLNSARAPIRPIVIIQSDDWGRVGIPSLDTLEEIRHLGFKVGDSPWDRYGLETTEDIDQLAATLAQFQDADGKKACMTANFVMANADLRQMAAEGWKRFVWKPIDEGFPVPWDADLMPSYRRAIEAGVFYPGLHGFTHFNTTELMAALNDSSNLGVRARALALRDVPYLRSVTPEYNFALVRCDAEGEHFLEKRRQTEWIEQGVKLFERAFGFRPVTACAPGYRGNEVTHELLLREGIGVTQDRHGDVPFELGGMLFLGRNVAFEPCLGESYNLTQAVAEASQAVAAGSPIVICSHSINYVSRFLNQAEFARGQLAQLLAQLKLQFPDLRFASDREFRSAWQNHASGWFRQPTPAEKEERIRRHLRQIGGVRRLRRRGATGQDRSTGRQIDNIVHGNDRGLGRLRKRSAARPLHDYQPARRPDFFGLAWQHFYIARRVSAADLCFAYLGSGRPWYIRPPRWRNCNSQWSLGIWSCANCGSFCAIPPRPKRLRKCPGLNPPRCVDPACRRHWILSRHDRWNGMARCMVSEVGCGKALSCPNGSYDPAWVDPLFSSAGPARVSRDQIYGRWFLRRAADDQGKYRADRILAGMGAFWIRSGGRHVHFGERIVDGTGFTKKDCRLCRRPRQKFPKRVVRNGIAMR